MELIITAIAAPLLGGVILLYLEHRTKWFANFSSQMRSRTQRSQSDLSWSKAEDKAVKTFMAQHPQFEIIGKESSAPEKGRKQLTLEIRTTRIRPRVLEKHQLVIDRTGDNILEPILISSSVDRQPEFPETEAEYSNENESSEISQQVELGKAEARGCLFRLFHLNIFAKKEKGVTKVS